MKYLIVHPRQAPEAVEIEESLIPMHTTVDGAIQASHPFVEEVAIMRNDEGKLLNLSLNRALCYPETGEIVETFFVRATQAGGVNFERLSDEQTARYTKLLRFPELFLGGMAT